MEVPVQYFQSIISLELAITGGLLYQIGFFKPPGQENGRSPQPYNPRVRLLMATILIATLFGSLLAILHEGQAIAAALVTIGLAVSLLPLLLWALPPLARDARTAESNPYSTTTIIGLLIYLAVVVVVVVSLVI